jgi:hypothetical protein
MRNGPAVVRPGGRTRVQRRRVDDGARHVADHPVHQLREERAEKKRRLAPARTPEDENSLRIDPWLYFELLKRTHVVLERNVEQIGRKTGFPEHRNGERRKSMRRKTGGRYSGR